MGKHGRRLKVVEEVVDPLPARDASEAQAYLNQPTMRAPEKLEPRVEGALAARCRATINDMINAYSNITICSPAEAEEWVRQRFGEVVMLRVATGRAHGHRPEGDDDAGL